MGTGIDKLAIKLAAGQKDYKRLDHGKLVDVHGHGDPAAAKTAFVGQFKVAGGAHYDAHTLSAQDAANFGTPGATHMLVGRHGHMIGSLSKDPKSKGGAVTIPDWSTRKGELSNFSPAVSTGAPNEALHGHLTKDGLGQQAHNRPTPVVSEAEHASEAAHTASRAANALHVPTPMINEAAMKAHTKASSLHSAAAEKWKGVNSWKHNTHLEMVDYHQANHAALARGEDHA
jgi:hypothetical protein